MEEASSHLLAAAPFVVKTYSMVNDPSTDNMVSWGRDNNSFVVIDPFAFSRTLLPANFKHSNFSSFVRQLNTYGFRKVDPDRWEFAHACFLKGQNHLLCRIVRRRTNPTVSTLSKKHKEEEQDDARIAAEVLKLKQEQVAIDDEVQRIWKRVEETEKKPKQMFAFLLRVADDPEFACRLLAQSGHVIKEDEDQGDQRRGRHNWIENGVMPTMAESVDGGMGVISPSAGVDFQNFFVEDGASSGDGGYCYMNPMEDVF